MRVSWPRGTIWAMNAAELRDRATLRVRRLTTGLIAGATLLTAAFAGVAASSTHTTKRVVHSVTRTPTKTVTAPTPTLVQNGSTVTPPTQSQSQSQSQAVTPSTSQPVVVAGGS